MGGCFSSGSSSKFNNVRLVHFSGYVEDFEQPISVNQVTGNSPKHFVCTSIQLLSSSSKPLEGDTQLQPGHVYFILPYSILQTEVSPLDLASLSKRLTSIAKTRRCEDKKSLKASSPFSSQNDLMSTSSISSQNGLMSTVCSSPSRSPCRVGVAEQIGLAYGGRSPCIVQPWKPVLDPIREQSFNRRSESDLQENC